MRWVLYTIADAANRDGDNARPGMQAIVEGSLYSQGSARRAIARLIEDGWIEVTERGGGGGHESVFRVLMGRSAEVSQDEQQALGPERADVAQKLLTQVSNNAKATPLSSYTDTDTVKSTHKTSAPETFPVTAEMRAWAKEAGGDGIDLERETQQFLDDRAAKGVKYVDWVRGWQTWIRNQIKWSLERSPRQSAQDDGSWVDAHGNRRVG